MVVIGASERPSIGRSVVENLQLMGYGGAIVPVNPRYETVLGLECRPSIDEIDIEPDVVVFCVGAGRVLETYRKLPEAGAASAVIFDGGFAEAGPEGRRRQAEIDDINREAGIALCGPNCMGLLNPPRRSGAYAQLVHDPAQLPGNVALVAQSGSICIGLMSDTRRFGFSVIVSSGNEAAVTTADYIDYLVDDPATRVIATFTETVPDPERYTAALDRAEAAGKPVVALKVGRSERTRRAITSHTGGLATGTRVMSEVLRAHGAIEVDGLDELTEVLAVCQGRRWPTGNRVSVVTASGGLAELLLDAAPAAGVELPPLSAGDRAAVEAVMGPVSGDGNPLDAWGKGQFMDNFPAALEVLAASGDSDAVVFPNDAFDGQPMGGPGDILAFTRLLVASARASDKPHFQLNTRPGLMHRAQADALAEAGVATIGGLRQGLEAIARVARFTRRRPAAVLDPVSNLGLVAGLLQAGPRATIHEHDAKRVLAAYGISVTAERMVAGPAGRAELEAAAAEVGFPLVVKAVSDAIPHRSDAGLVITGVADLDELERAHRQIVERLSDLGGTGADASAETDDGAEAYAGAGVHDGAGADASAGVHTGAGTDDGAEAYAGAEADAGASRGSGAAVLVQEMITDGIEVFAGTSTDETFGPVVSFGLGGTAVELLDDTALRILPLRAGDAEAMIDEIRSAPLLRGFRGRPPADVEALIGCIEALAGLAWAEREHLSEIDLNPILVRPEGRGCVVADALIVPRSRTPEPPAPQFF